MAREIVTKSGRFYSVSQSPDICKTPMGNCTPPIPYTIKGEFAQAKNVSPNISSHGDKIVLHGRSVIPTVTGDGPGTANGIKSGTVGKKVETKEKSSTVGTNGTHPVREGDVVKMNDNNTTGKIYERGGEAARPQIQGEPAVLPEVLVTDKKPASLWDKASPWVHGALGLASFVPGLSVATSGADALIYGAEGNVAEAGMAAVGMIPGGKFATAAAKAGKFLKGAQKAEEVAQAARKAEEAAQAARKAEEAAKEAKAAKEAEEAAKAGKAEENAAAKGKDGAKSKSKKKLKCGEYGKYGDLKKKTGDGKFDRDHIPSKAALKARAEDIKGAPLSTAEKGAIDNAADTIAIPRQAHIDVSPTYGQSLGEAAKDAQDLAGSARRDVDAMLKEIDKYDASGGCKKAYQKAAKRVLKKNNSDFDKWLGYVIKNATKK